MKVLIVDDSAVFRTMLKIACTQAGLEVTGAVGDGQQALQAISDQNPDVVILDLEMPVLTGIETLKGIKAKGFSCNVIVFAAQTTRGAATTIEALELGAVDVICKPNAETGSKGMEIVKEQLIPKVQQFDPANRPAEPAPVEKAREYNFKSKDFITCMPQAIVIASSTGGPVALEQFLNGIPKGFTIPIVIGQHMPPMFTKSLADRLGSLTGIPCAEAVDGAPLEPGKITIAPGDYHLELKKEKDVVVTRLDQRPKRNSIRPCVNYLFESACEIYGRHLIGFVLTGMGEDGKDGSIAIKEAGGGIMIQDQASCVVWGMPRSVYEVGAYDKISDLDGCNKQLKLLLEKRMAV